MILTIKRLIAVMGIVAAYSGCTGNQGAAAVPDLVATAMEEPGENCLNGGLRLDSGRDTNLNGVLDAEEVTKSDYLCSGADGGRTLVSTTVEEAGSNCVEGGQRIDYGADRNGDGILETDEIEGSSYLCDGSTGSVGLSTLVVTSVEAAGANCASGGQKIEVGVDDSEDGVLDTAEVDSTTYACDGSDGLQSLVVVTAESAGANCASGGQKIEVGLDANRDGLLGAGEVARTSYACDGAAGADGTSGLVNVTIEPPGSLHCAAGGQRIDAGIDVSGDGTLQAGEVTSTGYICNLVIPAERLVNGGFANGLTSWTATLNPSNPVTPGDTTSAWSTNPNPSFVVGPASPAVVASPNDILLGGMPGGSQASVLTQDFVVPFEVSNAQFSAQVYIDPLALTLDSSVIPSIVASVVIPTIAGFRIDIIAVPGTGSDSFTAPSLFNLFSVNTNVPASFGFLATGGQPLGYSPAALTMFLQGHLGETLQLRLGYVASSTGFGVEVSDLGLTL